MAKTDKIGVLVTTVHRGIFFGYLAAKGDADGKVVRIESARNGLYFSQDTKGFMGLASSGPGEKCKIGPAVPWAVLQDVTLVAGCTPQAIEAWEKAPWSN